MKKMMKYDEFMEFLSSYIDEPKSVKEQLLSQIDKPQDVIETLFYVNIEQDGTIKVTVSYFNNKCEDNYTIKMYPESRKYCLFSEKIRKDDSLIDIKSYQKFKFQLEHTANAWNNQEGFVVDTEERTSNFVRKNGDSFGKIVDYMWKSKRFFDKNGVEMHRNDTMVEYPDREQQYKFTFGLPELNSRTPIGYVNNSTYREGINTAVRFTTKADTQNVIKEKKNEYYMLKHENGRLPLLIPEMLIAEDEFKNVQEKNFDFTIEELNDTILKLVEEPMRTGLIERYGVTDRNNKRR